MIHRTIKYRALGVIDRIWHTGLVYRDASGDWYVQEELDEVGYWVDEGTLGQYTGLNDMHHKCIYEGDILKVSDTEFLTVRYRPESCGFVLTDDVNIVHELYPAVESGAYVAGNIYIKPNGCDNK